MDEGCEGFGGADLGRLERGFAIAIAIEPDDREPMVLAPGERIRKGRMRVAPPPPRGSRSASRSRASAPSLPGSGSGGWLRALAVAGLAVLCTGGLPGCRGLTIRDRATPRPLDVEPEPLEAREAVERINRNARRVRSLQAEPSIAVKVDGARYRVSGDVRFRRERDFRFVVKDPLGKKRSDIGSNEEGFWFWTRAEGDMPKEAYVCQYDAAGNAPIDPTMRPDWIVEALGLRPFSDSELRGAKVEEGTDPATGAAIWILTLRRVDTKGYAYFKETVIDQSNGMIREHKLLAPNRTPVAVARIDRHQTVSAPGGLSEEGWNEYDGDPDPETAILPDTMHLSWLLQGLEMTVNLGRPKVNQPIDPSAFREPTFPAGYARVDLVERMREMEGGDSEGGSGSSSGSDSGDGGNGGRGSSRLEDRLNIYRTTPPPPSSVRVDGVVNESFLRAKDLDKRADVNFLGAGALDYVEDSNGFLVPRVEATPPSGRDRAGGGVSRASDRGRDLTREVVNAPPRRSP